MNNTHGLRIKRNMRALLALGVLIALLASIGGAFIWALGSARSEVTQPLWKFGEYVMLLGVANLCIYSGIFFQVRRLTRAARDDNAV